jgi:hypothetical protein
MVDALERTQFLPRLQNPQVDRAQVLAMTSGYS